MSIAKESVKSFLYRFNDRAVFIDENISCTDILKTANISRYIKTIDDVDKIKSLTELIELLKLAYLEFIKTTPEKRDIHIFNHITVVYKSILEILNDCNSI